jgi:hypothetical protein
VGKLAEQSDETAKLASEAVGQTVTKKLQKDYDYKKRETMKQMGLPE